MKEQKKNELKHDDMIVYAIEILLPIKDILKTLPPNRNNNYIKI